MEPIHLRLEPADAEALKQEAVATGRSVLDIVRDAVREHAAREGVPRVLPLIEVALEKQFAAVRALQAKTLIQAGIATWLAQAVVVGTVLDVDPDEMYRQAKARALVDAQQRGTDRWGDEEIYDPADHAPNDAPEVPSAGNGAAPVARGLRGEPAGNGAAKVAPTKAAPTSGGRAK